VTPDSPERRLPQDEADLFGGMARSHENEVDAGDRHGALDLGVQVVWQKRHQPSVTPLRAQDPPTNIS